MANNVPRAICGKTCITRPSNPTLLPRAAYGNVNCMNMKHINRNFPWCDEYDEDSFTGTLNEKCSWSDEEYFKLDDELYDLAEKYNEIDQLPRELVWRIMRIFSYVMMTIGCHSNPNDGYTIENLNND